MTDSNTLHNAGMIPTLDTFSKKLAETAYPQGLPIVAALRDNALTLRTGDATLTLTLLRDMEQLDTAEILSYPS